jgi:hypothetical protein
MRKLALLLGLTGVLALALAANVRAVPPEHFPVEHVAETFIIEDQCDFPVAFHVEGDVRETLFFDRQGNEIRVVTVFPNFRVSRHLGHGALGSSDRAGRTAAGGRRGQDRPLLQRARR